MPTLLKITANSFHFFNKASGNTLPLCKENCVRILFIAISNAEELILFELKLPNSTSFTLLADTIASQTCIVFRSSSSISGVKSSRLTLSSTIILKIHKAWSSANRVLSEINILVSELANGRTKWCLSDSFLLIKRSTGELLIDR